MATYYHTWYNHANLHFADATTGWAAGRSCAPSAIPATIIKTTDGGETWSVHDQERHRYELNDAYFCDAQTGWVVGGNGLIFLTNDGGTTWQRQPSKNRSGLTTVRAAISRKAWSAGGNGTVLSTNTGGFVGFTDQFVPTRPCLLLK